MNSIERDARTPQLAGSARSLVPTRSDPLTAQRLLSLEHLPCQSETLRPALIRRAILLRQCLRARQAL